MQIFLLLFLQLPLLMLLFVFGTLATVVTVTQIPVTVCDFVIVVCDCLNLQLSSELSCVMQLS